jgi:uncharacterized protein (DUF2141 family)
MKLIIDLFVASLLFWTVRGDHSNIPLPFSDQQVKNHIDLTINNLKGYNGLVRIGIFTSDTGYPDQPAFNYSLAKDTLKNGKLKLVIHVDKSSLISISVLDDENGNGEMDYKFGIMPKEGFGFSNNPKVTSKKAPPFNITSFRFSGGEKKIDINMVYM